MSWRSTWERRHEKMGTLERYLRASKVGTLLFEEVKRMVDEGTPERELKHVRLQGEILRLEKTRNLLRDLLNEVQGNYENTRPDQFPGRPHEDAKKALAAGHPLNGTPMYGLAETLERAPKDIAAFCEEVQTDIIPQLKTALF